MGVGDGSLRARPKSGPFCARVPPRGVRLRLSGRGPRREIITAWRPPPKLPGLLSPEELRMLDESEELRVVSYQLARAERAKRNRETVVRNHRA